MDWRGDAAVQRPEGTARPHLTLILLLKLISGVIYNANGQLIAK
jgi:hypothetical protein